MYKKFVYLLKLISHNIIIVDIKMHKPFIPSIKFKALVKSSRHKIVKGILK